MILLLRLTTSTTSTQFSLCWKSKSVIVFCISVLSWLVFLLKNNKNYHQSCYDLSTTKKTSVLWTTSHYLTYPHYTVSKKRYVGAVVSSVTLALGMQVIVKERKKLIVMTMQVKYSLVQQFCKQRFFSKNTMSYFFFFFWRFSRQQMVKRAVLSEAQRALMYRFVPYPAVACARFFLVLSIIFVRLIFIVSVIIVVFSRYNRDHGCEKKTLIKV